MNNPCFLYVPQGTSYTLEEIRDMWHRGETFKVYRYGYEVTVASSLKLRMSQFTHVKIVFTLPDGEATFFEEELK